MKKTATKKKTVKKKEIFAIMQIIVKMQKIQLNLIMTQMKKQKIYLKKIMTLYWKNLKMKVILIKKQKILQKKN